MSLLSRMSVGIWLYGEVNTCHETCTEITKRWLYNWQRIPHSCFNYSFASIDFHTEVGFGIYCSSSEVFRYDMSPRTLSRSVIPHNLMAVSSSSCKTAEIR